MSARLVTLIDYGSGNLRSAGKALERAAREAEIEARIAVTDDPEAVAAADRVVLPGVGAFADCRQGLMARPGLFEALSETVMGRGRPFLGICVGLQLMATRGLEHGCCPGFDWIPGDVVELMPADPALKIPHMGWNPLSAVARHPVLDGIGPGMQAYFVHSYHLRAARPDAVLAECDYGGPVTAAAGRDNLFGTQFHPEKSQSLGLRLLANFLAWAP